ncbi:MAG: FAD binding domain-containing protein, partial [Treponema sp.]|nr:FAD binding domain-containing protein [Treponema sp.]
METKCFAPKTMEELFKALAEMTPESRVLGGGTDLIIRMNTGMLNPDALLYMGGMQELCCISQNNGKAEIGAASTMNQIAETPWIKKKLTALFHACSDIGSPQIRNNATIGGNAGSASPAGDIIPVLFLYNAVITIASKDGLYTKPIGQVILGPSKSCLAYNEAIVKISIDIPESPHFRSAFVKLGYRKA